MISLSEAKKVFSIDRGGDKPRKDISKWNEVKEYVGRHLFNFDQIYIRSNYSKDQTIAKSTVPKKL